MSCNQVLLLPNLSDMADPWIAFALIITTPDPVPVHRLLKSKKLQDFITRRMYYYQA